MIECTSIFEQVQWGWALNDSLFLGYRPAGDQGCPLRRAGAAASPLLPTHIMFSAKSKMVMAQPKSLTLCIEQAAAVVVVVCVWGVGGVGGGGRGAQ